MNKKGFGKSLDKQLEYVIRLDDFKDLILYHLEDYLFHNKFNERVVHFSIPKLGINFRMTEKYALDLHDFFNIPQISFDERGCVYDNGRESAYISPEFFSKCFVERVTDVWEALAKLYLPKYLMEDEKTRFKEEDFEDTKHEEKNQEKTENKIDFPHMDFVEAYSNLVNLHRLNQALSQGLVGLIGNPGTDINTITFLRKLEFASKFQKDLESIFSKMQREEYYEEDLEECIYGDFCRSDEFKILEKEHERLFSYGNFVAPLEEPDWEIQDRIYDFGTDEEREDWKKRYKELKISFGEKGCQKMKEVILEKEFPISKIKKRLIDYWKIKIYAYNYPKILGCNPLMNELGLNQTNYYAHPADKYMPERIFRKSVFGEYLDEIDPSDYDYLYGNVKEEYDEEYSSGIYRM